jgi:uncharacterized protein YjfI (DUF2170 family)
MSSLLEKLGAIHGMSDTGTFNGLDYEFIPIPGDIEVVQVIFRGREELPIYLTQSDSQMIGICYLWDECEVLPARRTEMLESMLDMNIPIPLSSFGKIGSRYTIFGALSLDASVHHIAKELTVLSDNALDAIEAMSDYLK